MQAFQTKSECGSAILKAWQGTESDPIMRVGRAFFRGSDADIDLVRAAHGILSSVQTLDEPRIQDEERANLSRIVIFLDRYIQDQKKR